MTGDLLADLRRGRRHDVEVAGVRRQVVAGALDLDEDRHPGRTAAGRPDRTAGADAGGSRARTAAPAATTSSIDASIASWSASSGIWQKIVSRMISGGSAGLRMMIALPRSAPPSTSTADDVVRVNSSMLARVPGPAERDATVATISAYGTVDRPRRRRSTIGMVAWPPQVTMLTFISSRCSVEVDDRDHVRPDAPPASGRRPGCPPRGSAGALRDVGVGRRRLEHDVGQLVAARAASRRPRRRPRRRAGGRAPDPRCRGRSPTMQRGSITSDRSSLNIRSVPMLPDPTIAAVARFVDSTTPACRSTAHRGERRVPPAETVDVRIAIGQRSRGDVTVRAGDRGRRQWRGHRASRCAARSRVPNRAFQMLVGGAACTASAVASQSMLRRRAGHRHRGDGPAGVADRRRDAHQAVVRLVHVAGHARRADLIEVGPQCRRLGDRVGGAPRQRRPPSPRRRPPRRRRASPCRGRCSTPASARRAASAGRTRRHDPFEVDDLPAVEHAELHGETVVVGEPCRCGNAVSRSWLRCRASPPSSNRRMPTR